MPKYFTFELPPVFQHSLYYFQPCAKKPQHAAGHSGSRKDPPGPSYPGYPLGDGTQELLFPCGAGYNRDWMWVLFNWFVDIISESRGSLWRMKYFDNYSGPTSGTWKRDFSECRKLFSLLLWPLFLFQDCHVVDEATLEEDESQDYQLLSVTENETSTTMLFKRHLRTCDPGDQDITVRNRVETNLLSYPAVVSNPPDQIWGWQFFLTTVYICRNVKKTMESYGHIYNAHFKGAVLMSLMFSYNVFNLRIGKI